MTPVADELLRSLVEAVGEDAVAPAAERGAYAADESGLPPAPPDVVVRPADTAGVAAVLALAHRLRVSVTPVGGHTGLAGGAVPRGGIALSLERLDRIEPVDRENLRVVCGAGARTADVAAAAAAAGLLYPPDPASLERSTIGGNVATNAGGPRCLRYGVTGDHVLALEAVAADGRVFRTGPATRKSALGPDLARLLVGSEGTLAVVTEATLRLVPAPAARAAATARFGSTEAAGAAVAAVVGTGLLPSALELLDGACAELLGLGLAPLLLVEVDGREAEAELALVETVLRAAGAEALEPARSEADVERLWRVRRALSPALAAAAPDWLFQDVCVPPAAIPEALRRIAAVAERHRLRIPVFGHAGDGNLHPSVLYDAAAGEAATAHAAEAEILRAAVELGGAPSAEHGIGLLKRLYLAEAADPVALELVRSVKRALDPRGILNPGKLYPEPPTVVSLHDYERLAAGALDPAVHGYYAGGAEDERTLRAGEAAWGRWELRPRVLVDVAAATTATTVLGVEVSLPVLLGPAALQGLAHPDGELAAARAAAAAGTIFCLSTLANRSPAEVAAAAPAAPRWFQLYCYEDEGVTRALVEQAADSGYRAIVLTADAPVPAKRDRDVRNDFRLDPSTPVPSLAAVLGGAAAGTTAELFSRVSASLTWPDLERLAASSPLPVVLKGVLTAEDARLACEHGAAAVVVSDHGGRQLDGAVASADALAEVVDAVAGRVEVLVDGGIRRGGDVVKALAAGARAVLVARPFLWALAVAGEDGVRHVLELLREETALALANLGCPSPRDVTRAHVAYRHQV